MPTSKWCNSFCAVAVHSTGARYEPKWLTLKADVALYWLHLCNVNNEMLANGWNSCILNKMLNTVGSMSTVDIQTAGRIWTFA